MKKTISLLLVMALLCSLLPMSAFAAQQGTLTVTPSVKVAARGESFTADLVLSDNPGIAGLKITLSYNSAVLTLTDLQRADLTDGMFYANKETGIITWASGTDSSFNGVIARATFTVNGDAAVGNTAITPSFETGDITNAAFDDISLEMKAGSLPIAAVHEHTWGEWTENSPATCTEAGERQHTCSACGTTVTEIIPAKGHSTAVIPGTPATCTEAGLTDGTRCSVCGDIITPQTTIPAKGHSWGEWTVTSPATCTEDGAQEHVCSVCGDKQTRTVSAHGHTTQIVAGKPATCTEEGLTDGTRCSVCGDIITPQTTIPAKGHSWGEWAVSSPATCTEDGAEERVCSACGDKQTRPVPAHGHTVEIENAKPATCTEDGYTGDEVCSVCKQTINAGTVITSMGHTLLIDPAIPATCTDSGLTEGCHCSVCEEVITPQQEIPATGHSWNGGEISTVVGYDTPGIKVFTCSNCSETYTEEIPAVSTLTCARMSLGEISWFISQGGTLEISGVGCMTDCGDAAAYPWHDYRGYINTLSVGAEVSNIGSAALAGMGALSLVSLPAGLAQIGENAFAGCTIDQIIFSGTKQQFDAISIAAGNEALLSASVHYLGSPEEDITGISLADRALYVELYKTDYTQLNLLIRFAADSIVNAPITSAAFTDEATASMFDLVVSEQEVYIVPKTEAVHNPTGVKSTYTSAVSVTVGGRSFEAGTIRLTVRKTLPALRAASLAFNTFNSFETKTITITGGNILSIRANDAYPMPSWLTLDADSRTLTLNNAAKSVSGRVYMLATVEGYSAEVPVILVAKGGYTPRAVRLSAGTVTVQPLASASKGVALKLSCGLRNQTLSGLAVTEITAPDGYRIDDFRLDTGEFRLVPTADPVAGRISLEVHFADTSCTVPLTLSVRVGQITLRPAKTSVIMNPRTGDSVTIPLTYNPVDFICTEPGIRLTDYRGTTDKTESGELDISYANDSITIKTTSLTPYNTSYRLWVCPYAGARECAISIRTLAENRSTVSVRLRATGSVDLSFPGSAAGVTATFLNCNSAASETLTVIEKYGRTLIGDVTELFNITKNAKGVYELSEKTPGTLDLTKQYYAQMLITMPNGDTALSPETRFIVRRTPVTLRLSAGRVTLNPDLVDPAQVTVTCITKNYVMGEPLIKVMDARGRESAEGQLDVSCTNGVITVAANAQTVPGMGYRIMVSAGEEYRASLLSVTVLKSNTPVRVATRISGLIDTLRSGSSITVLKPTIFYYNKLSAYDISFAVKGYKGRTLVGDFTSLFSIEEIEKGWSVKAAGEIDTTVSYRLQMSIAIPRADGGTYTVFSPEYGIYVRMGSARVTSNVRQVQLCSANRYGRGIVKLTMTDGSLNKIASVKLRENALSAPFTLTPLGDGRYAISFKEGMPTPTRTVTLYLDVYLEGNATSRFNTSIAVRVLIVK